MRDKNRLGFKIFEFQTGNCFFENRSQKLSAIWCVCRFGASIAIHHAVTILNVLEYQFGAKTRSKYL